MAASAKNVLFSILILVSIIVLYLLLMNPIAHVTTIVFFIWLPSSLAFDPRFSSFTLPIAVFCIAILLLLPALYLRRSTFSLVHTFLFGLVLLTFRKHVPLPDHNALGILEVAFKVFFAIHWVLGAIQTRISMRRRGICCWFLAAALLSNRISFQMSIIDWITWSFLFNCAIGAGYLSAPWMVGFLCVAGCLCLMMRPDESTARMVFFTMVLSCTENLFIAVFAFWRAPDRIVWIVSGMYPGFRLRGNLYAHASERADFSRNLCSSCIEFTSSSHLVLGSHRFVTSADEWHLVPGAEQVTQWGTRCQLCALLWHTVDREMTLGAHLDSDAEWEVNVFAEGSALPFTYCQLHFGRQPAGRRLLIYTDELFNRGWSSPTSIETSTGSDAHMNLAKQWISNCQANHDRCNSSQPGQRVLPSRLISIDAPILGETTPQARLVLTDSLPKDETTEYCALSHSWGGSSPLRLLEDNLEGLLKSINTSLLSKNIQDALVVAHRLEFKYIWVDSICIIQNSAQDWRTEAAKMGDVYAGAFLTIAATGSNSGDGGCFHERDPVVFNRCEIGVSSVDELMPVRRYICQDDLTDLRHGVDIAPLNRRGWVLQERLLSRRILHFGSTMLYWECGQRAASEMNTNGFVYKQFPADFYGNFIPSSDLHPSGPPRGIKNRWNGIFQQFTPSSDFSLDDRVVWKQRSESFWKEPRRRTYTSWDDASECGHRTALERLLASDPSSRAEYGFLSPSHCWYEIVEAYTRSRLSFSTDRFDAIGGIVKRIEQSTNRVCIAGLWEDTLGTDLLWFAFEKPGERRIRERLPASREELLRRRDESISEPRIAPSWSWMSVDAVISIDLLPSTADGRLTGTSLLTKCSASIENVDSKTGDRIWNAVQGKLEVEGPFQRCTPRTLNCKLCLTLDEVSDEIPLAAFFPDLDLFEEQLQLWDLYCLSVLSLKTMDGDLLQLWKHSEEDIHGIVVRRADFGELFEEWECINGELTVERWVRVGYFSTRHFGMFWARDWRLQRQFQKAPKKCITII